MRQRFGVTDQEPTPLSLVPAVEIDARQRAELVEMLEGVLAEAQAGDIVAVAIACEHRNRHVATGYILGDGDLARLVGSIELVKDRLLAIYRDALASKSP